MQEWMDDTIIHNLTKEEREKKVSKFCGSFYFSCASFFLFFFSLCFSLPVCTMYNSKLLQMLMISLTFGECVCEMMSVYVCERERGLFHTKTKYSAKKIAHKQQ